MIPSIHSSSSSSNRLSIILPLAVEVEGGQTTPTHSQISGANTSREAAEKSTRKSRSTGTQNSRESLFGNQTKYGPGARSSTPPIENTHHDKFFGLSQEYSFAYNGSDQDSNVQLDPAFQFFVKALPESAFSESEPQNGLSGLNRYVATPRSGDAVRYFRP
ncbi:hypothetical protein TWF481_001681 [Arthrobotrys musiformis]|uniref:Uncharacterized protein n=1 Tax=Arthrobotrys musiformis TaxID=47236 RepID=A0AAV9VV27_9PEZI